ncbi:MAG: 23S rRNA (adenine(2503)-C(2))-methyltransferase RlmN, partial [Oscillospiraceae bacterium]|nr:23S rRNA (adenine(2503)-C(2))-methyltransferase RlmN [Oscillospiraceae bacterium]
YGLSERAISLSTCGIVPGIYELAAQKRQLTLAVSLHSASDEGRSRLMPINKKYPLEELKAACKFYFETTGRRISLEYALIENANDGAGDAQRLASFARELKAHINLIPVNPVEEGGLKGSRLAAAHFCERLKELGANATVRRTLGDDVNAACGQLRRRSRK